MFWSGAVRLGEQLEHQDMELTHHFIVVVEIIAGRKAFMDLVWDLTIIWSFSEQKK